MIDSDHFVAAFDTQAGRFSLRRRDGTPFLTGARLRLETSLGPWSPSGGVVRVTTHAFRDALGSGRCLRVECREPFDGPLVLLVGRVRHSLAPGAAARGSSAAMTPLSCLGNSDRTASSAARAPGQVELFARGPHDGPQTFETGDPRLRIDRSVAAH